MARRTRTETDPMGALEVPHDALYGAQTARAARNFPISGLRLPRAFLAALGLIKRHAAAVNVGLGLLPESLGRAIAQAAQEVADGEHDGQFVVDVFQTGSGTSTNMNANEVIANRAAELLGGRRGDRSVHPNDHVNRGQSSNDVMPTALHLAVLDRLVHGLQPALRELRAALAEVALRKGHVVKPGRTHLQDATPIRVGQVFRGYASQLDHGLARLAAVVPDLCELALGGTAVGTGLNADPRFAAATIAALARATGLPLREAADHCEAQAARDACVAASGALKTVAVSLHKIADDLRWLGSGPRCGLGELRLPALQPGSSIMPGKVNPVLCESMLQVTARVVGNDATITWAGAGGNFELNAMLPVIAHALLQSVELLTNASRLFADRCIAGIEVDEARCAGLVEQSLMLATALVPAIGYDRAAAIAKAAHESGRPVRDVARDLAGLDEAELQRLLDPRAQTGPPQDETGPTSDGP